MNHLLALPWIIRFILALLVVLVSTLPIVVIGLIAFVPMYLLERLHVAVLVTVSYHVKFVTWLIGIRVQLTKKDMES